MNKYYIYLDNVQGPFTREALCNMYQKKVISSTTQVCCGKNTPWKCLSEYTELMNCCYADLADMQQTDAPIVNDDQAVVRQQSSEIRSTPSRGQIQITAGQQPQINISQQTYTQAHTQSQVQSHPGIQAENQSEEVVFYCPNCNQKFAGEASWLGRDVICTKCQEIFTAGDEPEKQDSLQGINTSQIPVINWEDSTGNIICPHCWVRFNSEHLLYIASHPTLMGDPVLGPGAMQRFSPTQFNANGQALDAMSYACTELACPRCRLKIPSTVIDEKTLYFSIVGAQSSGKSYYLATLLNLLSKNMSNDFACSLIDVDPELNMVLDNYIEMIFRPKNFNQVAVLPKTQQTGDRFTSEVILDNIQVHLPKPFVYELRHLAADESHLDCNIIFYDNAGEHFDPGTDNASNPGTRHLACSDGIIFIFDPLNDALMRNDCDPAEPQLASDQNVKDQNKLLSEMIARIRRHRNLEVNEKCSVPLILGVCKYDSWKDIFKHDLERINTLTADPNGLASSWDYNMVMNVSFELRELMLKYSPEMVSTAEGFFEKVIFVPFSNFGSLASKTENGDVGVIPANIKPIWVQDTFVCLLAENNLINITPPPESAIKMPTNIVKDFLVFRHPVSGNTVRLPWNYSEVVLKIDGQNYALPKHPKAEQLTKNTNTGFVHQQEELWS